MMYINRFTNNVIEAVELGNFENETIINIVSLVKPKPKFFIKEERSDDPYRFENLQKVLYIQDDEENIIRMEKGDFLLNNKGKVYVFKPESFHSIYNIIKEYK